MTDRIPLDDMTSDQLDQLYAEIDRLTAELADYDERAERLSVELRRYTENESADAAAGSYAGRAEAAEAAIERVRAETAYMRSVSRSWEPAADRIDAALDGTALGTPGTPGPAATQATEPATITDPEWLRQQYADAITAEHYRRAKARIVASPEEHSTAMADAVLRVRDRHLDQLRQRLQLAHVCAVEPLTEADRGRDDGPREWADYMRGWNNCRAEMLAALDSEEYAIADAARWLHIAFTSPDPTTANTSALNLRDHLAAEFDGIHMRITTNAVEGESVNVCTTACDEQHVYDWTCALFAGGDGAWKRLEARAFNAVLPALRGCGERLPLSARRVVAKAVLAELRPELAALAAEQPAPTTAKNPPAPREQLYDAIEHEMYEYRERTMLWGETEGVTEEITRLATRGALSILQANPAPIRDLIDTVLRTTPRAGCADWPAREAHGQGHRYDMRCALCAGEADTLTDAIHAALQPRLAALAEYENAITWHTTCLNCARVLDSCIRETGRAEKAEGALREVLARLLPVHASGKVIGYEPPLPIKAAAVDRWRTVLDEERPEPGAWTPPPPGSTAEQLPVEVLDAIRPGPYLSTACHAAFLCETTEPTEALTGWSQRLHSRCRINNKFTGALCVCSCHPPKEQQP